MTTIAWRDGVIASDRQCSSGGIITKCRKLFKVGHYAIGTSGNLSVGMLFCQWWADGRREDCPLDESTYALVMDINTGVCEIWEHPGVGIPIEEDFSAIGSGAAVAYGALHTGATAREAVTAAIKWDDSTGIGVQAISAKN